MGYPFGGPSQNSVTPGKAVLDQSSKRRVRLGAAMMWRPQHEKHVTLENTRDVNPSPDCDISFRDVGMPISWVGIARHRLPNVRILNKLI